MKNTTKLEISHEIIFLRQIKFCGKGGKMSYNTNHKEFFFVCSLGQKFFGTKFNDLFLVSLFTFTYQSLIFFLYFLLVIYKFSYILRLKMGHPARGTECLRMCNPRISDWLLSDIHNHRWRYFYQLFQGIGKLKELWTFCSLVQFHSNIGKFFVFVSWLCF